MSVLDTALRAIDQMYDGPRRAHRELLEHVAHVEAVNAELKRRVRLAREAALASRSLGHVVSLLDLRKPLPKRSRR